MKSNHNWSIPGKRLFIPSVVLLLSLILIMVSCSLEPQRQSTYSNQSEKGKANLILNISSGFQTKTLLPDIDMTPVNFDLQGSGPNGAGFNATTEQTMVEFSSLDPGDWTVNVNGKNIDNTIISMGKGIISLKPGDTITLDVIVTPIEGYGTLDIAVHWTPGDVTNPSIIAQLIPATGSPIDLNFTIGQGEATCINNTIPTGYHTLEVQLLDSGVSIMGAVEVVRIINEQVTSGVFDFFDINQLGGDITVNITPEMEDPIEVVMDGQLAQIPTGESMTVSASAPQETENMIYVWYVNGESKGTGTSFTVGSELPKGVYRLDVTAFSTDGKRAGSTTHTFNVIEPSQVTLEWDPNTEQDLKGYKIYYGPSNSNYTNTTDVGNQVTYTVIGLMPGETYYFAATAYNTAGLESDYSNEVVYTVPL